jgi:hypothetical protein
MNVEYGSSIHIHASIHFRINKYDVVERELSYTSVAYLSFIQRKSPERVCSLEVTFLSWFDTRLRSKLVGLEVV